MPLSIAFLDPSPAEYTADSPYERPLGGTQSAVAYLAAAMAMLGHTVALFTTSEAEGMFRGVYCAPRRTGATLLQSADAVVVINSAKAELLTALRRMMRPGARLVTWTHLPADQPINAHLGSAESRRLLNTLVTVSRWQKQGLSARFDLSDVAVATMGNGVSPAFERMFDREPVLPAKSKPPVLAYTSAPYRGLDRLLDGWEMIRSAVPGVQLRVYAGMVTQFRPEEDAAYAGLYDRCRREPGVTLVGPLPQPDLAAELRQVSCLAYPNTFPETFCIAALEGLAAGCRVVTSDLGGIPEATAGYAKLVPVLPDPAAHARLFAETVITELNAFAADPTGTESRLRAQLNHVRTTAGWARRALGWAAMLSALADAPVAGHA